MKLYSYNNSSASAKALCAALGIKRIKHEGKPLVIRETVVNWGCSNPSRNMLFTEYMLNPFDAVGKAANKLQAFKAMSEGVTTPKWTESREEASGWLNEGVMVVCRTILNGHSGNGIVIAAGERELVDAPLYTQYVKKDQEYRIHVNKGQVFFVQRKARNKGVADENVNWQVRNHHNGFIYANKDVDVAVKAKEQAIMAVHDLGLDFGAVDVISSRDGSFYVLEVNTAPGLAGVSVEKYVEQFKEVV